MKAIMRDEREMKDSGIEWIGRYPLKWDLIANKYVMHKEKNICEKWNQEDVLSLTMNGVIVRDLINPSGKMPATFDGYQYVEKGNLLMCLFDIDVTPRCVGRVSNNGVTSPAYSNFKIHCNADLGYFYYYYLMMDHTKELLHLAKNLRHSFTEEQLGQLKVPLPPIKEQQLIANYLDDRCSKIDAIIAEAKASIEEYKELKQAVIYEAVTKGLDKNVEMKDSGIEWIGKIPKSWGTPHLSQIAYIYSGGTPNRNHPEYWNGNIPWLKTGELKNNEIFSAEEFITQDGLDNSSAIIFPENTILMAMYGQGKTRGMTAILKTPCATNQACAGILLFNDKIETDFLWICLMGAYNAIRQKAVGAGQPNLSLQLIGSFKVTMPSLAEQKSIVEYVKNKNILFEEVISEKQSLIEDLESYKKSLIYEVVTGKRKVVK